MKLTPDYSRVATPPTDQQWHNLISQNPLDTLTHRGYLDALEERNDPNLNVHRYFLDLRARFGGNKEEVIGDDYDFVVSIVFDFDHITLREEDEWKAESNEAIISLQGDQVVVTDHEDSSMSVPISEYDDFQGVTRENLLTALLRWWNEATTAYRAYWEATYESHP